LRETHTTRQHALGRCLAGTVRSEKADDLAFLNLKRDVVDSKIARVLLGNFLNSDHISLSRALRGPTLNRSLVESSKFLHVKKQRPRISIAIGRKSAKSY